MRGVARINNIDAGGVQPADAHGIRVRSTSTNNHDDDDGDDDDDDDD